MKNTTGNRRLDKVFAKGFARRVYGGGYLATGVLEIDEEDLSDKCNKGKVILCHSCAV